MKTLIAVLIAVISSQAQANLESPFASEVAGLSIANSHVLERKADGTPLIVRGMAPNAMQIQELRALGIEKVLIFKNETKDEVQTEKIALIQEGFPSENIIQIAFPWKDLRNFHESCRMTIEALQAIELAEAQTQALFFHCTVGEDRTGYLAGLFQIWKNAQVTPEVIFENELCKRGYEAGDKLKPPQVIAKIRETLTPTFLKMALLLQQWQKQGQALDAQLCPQDFNLPTENQLQCH